MSLHKITFCYLLYLTLNIFPAHVSAKETTVLKPSINLSLPDKESLHLGSLLINFTVENMTLMPLYVELNGDALMQVSPKIGHLHVMMDEGPWQWIHDSNGPIYISPLSKGPHTLRVALAEANHNEVDVKTIKFIVP